MLSSLLFFIVVALNVGLIGVFLLAPLRAGCSGLFSGLTRSRRYTRARLTGLREKALRARTLRLMRQVGVVVMCLAGVLVSYLPSMLFAVYRSSLEMAFYSVEALAGMLAGALFIYLRGRAS